MSRRTTRLGYLGTVLVLAVLLVLFGQPYLFCMLQLLLALGITQAVCIRRDARRLHFTVCGPGSCRAGEDMLLTLRPCYTGRLLAAKYALVQMEVCNDMLSASRRYELMVPLYEGAAAELRVPAAACGGVSVRCAGMQVWDMLSLSCAQAPLPETIYTMVWPRTAKVRLEPQLDTAGAAQWEGAAQNRRGSDISEVYDFREYVPGDDVRGIHWKISCKNEHLFLREASDPAHYEAALLADLGLARHEGQITPAELNGAAALMMALGQQILRRGQHFCLLYPAGHGLVRHLIRSEEELLRRLPGWLGEPLPAQAGLGLQLFCAAHLEQRFTRLIIVSAGPYEQDLQLVQQHTGISVVCAAQQEQPVYTTLSPTCEMAVLPADLQSPEGFRVIC